MKVTCTKCGGKGSYSRQTEDCSGPNQTPQSIWKHGYKTHYKWVDTWCGKCDGTGKIEHTEIEYKERDCYCCFGTGREDDLVETGGDGLYHKYITRKEKCTVCNGYGRIKEIVR